jgi:hypothetical protein
LSFKNFKREVVEKENFVNQYFVKWNQLSKERGNSSELEWLTNEINEKLNEMELDLGDLKETIDIVESISFSFF